MTRQDYLKRVAIAISNRPRVTSKAAFDQMRRLNPQTSGSSEKSPSSASSSGRKTQDSTTKN